MKCSTVRRRTWSPLSRNMKCNACNRVTGSHVSKMSESEHGEKSWQGQHRHLRVLEMPLHLYRQTGPIGRAYVHRLTTRRRCHRHSVAGVTIKGSPAFTRQRRLAAGRARTNVGVADGANLAE